MIIKEIVNNDLNKSNLLQGFQTLIFDKKFRDNQINEVKRALTNIQSDKNPYEICAKRIFEIISTTI